ncbi:MAG: c-type cytochrome [Hyphomicrobiaceae bacterium]
MATQTSKTHVGRSLISLVGLTALLCLGSTAEGFDISNGRKLYEANCASCHGEKGKPTMVNVPDFTRGEGLARSDAQLIDSIKAGKGLMPGYDGMFSRDDIQDVLIYLRTLWF